MKEINKKLNFDVNDIRSDEFKEIQKKAYENDLARLHKRLKEFVRVECPACGNRKSKYRFKKYQCDFNECEICSTLYMSPRPTPEIMSDYYDRSENYYIWNKYIFPNSENARRERICQPNLVRLIGECEQRGFHKPDLFEVGPGFGTFAEISNKSEFFKTVSVVERTPSMAEACRQKGLRVIESTLEEASIEFSETADVAVFFEVIEHVFEPIKFLQSVRQILRPGGLIMLTCPNGKGFDTEMLGEQSPAVDTEHVNLFNPHSIEVLLSRLGFQVLAVETPGVLDVDIVRRAQLAREIDLSSDPFWERLFCTEFESLGSNFQTFLSENRLSGNMRTFAIKTQ